VDAPVFRRSIVGAAGLFGLLALGLVIAQIVMAEAPTAAFTITPTTAEVGDTVTFNASASSDPDGDITTYEWDFDYDGSFDVDASVASPTTTHVYTSAGPKSVALRVIDGDVNDGTLDVSPIRVQSLTVVVTPPPNQPPVAVLDCPATVFNPLALITCNGSGSSDPDGSISEYEWSVDNGPFTDGAAQFTTFFVASGTHSIRLRVRDNNGALSTVQADSVTVNSPPTADITMAVGALPALPPDATVNGPVNQTTPLAGQTVTFDSAGSSDSEGAITRTWDIDGNGFNDGAGISLPVVFAAGPQTVQLLITDGNGAAATDSVSFRVNSLPSVDFVTNNPTPVIDQSVAFLSRSSDPDNDINAYAWDFDNDGQFGEAAQAAGITCQTPTSPNASCQFDNAGTYPVSLRITDAGGISRVATQQILIQSTVPNGDFSFSPEAPVPGQGITFSSTSTPSPGKQLTAYEWDFNYNGVTFTADAAGHTVTQGFSSAGPKTVALRVSEAMPGGGPATGGHDITSRTITVNAPPTAGLRISPQTPFVADPITISSTSVDSDGPIARQDWDLDGDGQFDDASGPVVSTSYPRAGQRRIGLRVTDGRGAVATASGVINVRTRPLATLTALIRLRFGYGEDFTEVSRLTVKAPRGVLVTVKCKGKGCPKKSSKRGKGKLIRFKTLERRLLPGVKLTVTVAKTGFIGRETTFTIRSGRPPKRVDRCIKPGAKRAISCPS
jgi:PKD repeat protein